MDRADLLDSFLALLRARAVRFCVIGGQAVNAYAEPVVSLDLDVVVAVSDLEALEGELRRQFTVEPFAHSLNISATESDLRIQIQTDPRYAVFLDSASDRIVLGVTLPVASVEDVLAGKIWAAEDPKRRASKRQKDLADIARIIEARPDLRARVPESVLRKLVS